jgi:hypothetical protein
VCLLRGTHLDFKGSSILPVILFPCRCHSANVPYSSSFACCSCRRDKRAKPKDLPKSNVLPEIGKHWTEPYFHAPFNHNTDSMCTRAMSDCTCQTHSYSSTVADHRLGTLPAAIVIWTCARITRGLCPQCTVSTTLSTFLPPPPPPARPPPPPAL